MSIYYRAAVILICLTMIGCAGNRAKTVVNEYHSRLDPLIGASAETVLMQFGAPTEVEHLAGFEVWRYYHYYGHREAGRSWSIGIGNNNDRRKAVSMYDDVSLYMKDDTLVKWTCQVQR